MWEVEEVKSSHVWSLKDRMSAVLAHSTRADVMVNGLGGTLRGDVTVTLKDRRVNGV